MAANVRISSVSRRAEAFDGVRASVAMGVLAAQRGGTVGFLLHSAAVIRVPSCARIAHALGLLQRVLAVGVGAAGGVAGGRLDGCCKFNLSIGAQSDIVSSGISWSSLTRHAKEIRIPDEVRVAHAFVGSRVARGAHAAHHALAAALAPPAYAHAWLSARDFRGANIRLALPAGERIPHETLDALARRPAVTHDALRPGTAHEPVAFYTISNHFTISIEFK